VKVVAPVCQRLQYELPAVRIDAGSAKAVGAIHGIQVSIRRKAYLRLTILLQYMISIPMSQMMLTGGSPTMHPALVNELTHFAHERNITITIETEGSQFVSTDYPIGLVSLSPKFNNSVPRVGITTPAGKVVDEKFIDTHNRHRLNYEAIQKMIEYHTDYHYKPVWDGTEETLQEIEAFRVKMDIPKNKTWIMPAGDNRQELINIYPQVFEMCAIHGYNFTGREHIIAYDTKRGV